MSADPASSPTWRSADAYRALLSADPAVWAWEFARRAPGAGPAFPAGETGFTPCYVEGPPGQDGAPAVLWPWEADERLPVLSVRRAAPGEGVLDLRRLDLPVLVVRRETGDQHVLVADQGRRLRFAVTEGDVLQGPSACFASLSPQRGGAASLEGLRQLILLQASGRLPKGCGAPPSRSPKWLSALQAFDARQGGASQREIAGLLFGRRRVDDDWNGPSDYMRMRVHRLLRAAEGLVCGGYRRLFGLVGSRATGGEAGGKIVEVWRSARWLAVTLLAVRAGLQSWVPGFS